MPTFRPPTVPVSFAQLAARDRGAQLADPVRTTPIQPWHLANGAVFEDVGQWKRPRYFPRDGESMDEAVLRECAAARTGVAVMDATTLGKIDIQGPDAGIFLDRVYTNMFSTLKVGSCRYGVMCRADGMVFDDGVTSRIGEQRFHMTTTTGNAAPVLDHLEEWLQTEWPELRVHATSVTEQWTTVAVVGPRAREVVGALAPDLDVSNDAFPFMTWREAVIAGTPGRVFRISFSGELAFELNVPTWHGLALWEAVMAAGEPLGITPYGTEAMHVLRAEKGYPIIGQETDGTVTPQDLGMAWAVSTKKDFIGRRSQRRPDAQRPDRKQLVGLLPIDPERATARGRPARRPDADLRTTPVPMLGHVTSSYQSAALGARSRWRSSRAAATGSGSACSRRWSMARSRRRSSTRSCSTRRTGGATGSRPRDGGRAACPLAARGRGAAGARPRAAVPRPARPPRRPVRRRPDGPADRGARRPPTDRAEHRGRVRRRHAPRPVAGPR